MSESTQETKKFYQRPENLLVYGGIAAGGWAALNALDTILPLVNRVLENALYTGVLGVTLALSLYVITSKDWHRLAWYGYRSAMRWVTGRFVELDPIGIMKSYVEKLHENLGEISKAIAALKGQARALEEKIQEKTSLHDKSMDLAAAAKKQGGREMEATLRLQLRKAGRAGELGETYQGLLNKVRSHIAVMEKVQEAANFMVADIEDTVEGETEKRKMIRASYKAMSASQRILAADAQREMYDLAIESTARDYHAKLGEIEQFMDDSKSFIQGMDLENGAYDESALKKLEEWEKRSASLLEGGTGKTKFRVAPAGEESGPEESPPQQQSKAFGDLFDSLNKS